MLLFGFEGYHLFEFHGVGERTECSKIKLSQSLNSFGHLNYTYDFGDCWEFKITLEKTLPKDSEASYPCCIKSKGGMMLEDCGGGYGYKLITDWCRKKTKSSKKVLLDFYGDPEALEEFSDFDPDAFDINEANKRINEMFMNETSR